MNGLAIAFAKATVGVGVGVIGTNVLTMPLLIISIVSFCTPDILLSSFNIQGLLWLYLI
jgi:hypothetical protein